MSQPAMFERHEVCRFVRNLGRSEVLAKRIGAGYAAGQYERPCVLFRPKLTIDGDMWCALYGEDLQEGVAGFGKSPADAMWDFDRNWETKLK